MSGTSCDGLDMALLDIDCSNGKHSVQKTIYQPYPNKLRKHLMQLIDQEISGLEEIKQIETELSVWTAKQVNTINADIDIIAMHGQTIFYRPPENNTMGLSWQLGSIQHVAKLTGKHVVGDFRSADIALMGRAAPLVPYYDYKLYNRPELNQLILNIGGISNGSFLPKDCRKEDVRAWDFGPGNCLIDLAMQTLFQRDFDENGKTALGRSVKQELIDVWIQNETYFKREPAKSTGREYFNSAYLERIIKDCKSHALTDGQIIAQITTFTVDSILWQLDHFKLDIDEIVISGGGARNQAIIDRFQHSGIKLNLLTEQESDFKEAIIFGLMAFDFLNNESAALQQVTGASKESVLGSLARP